MHTTCDTLRMLSFARFPVVRMRTRRMRRALPIATPSVTEQGWSPSKRRPKTRSKAEAGKRHNPLSHPMSLILHSRASPQKHLSQSHLAGIIMLMYVELDFILLSLSHLWSSYRCAVWICIGEEENLMSRFQEPSFAG